MLISVILYSHYHANVKLEIETKTIKKVLEDICGMTAQQHKRISDNDKAMLANLKTIAKKEYNKIHQLIRDNCSWLNFVEELKADIENMRKDAKDIVNAEIRKEAESDINDLEQLAKDLSYGK